MERTELDRRNFLVSAMVVAGGMGLALHPADAASATATGPWEVDPRGPEFSPWIVIQPDDTVVVRSPTPECGNGSMTQVAMNVTEELACDWSRVRVEFASINRDYLQNNVYAKGSLPFFGGHGTDAHRMRHALQLGASARERLKAAAAARWKVPATEVEAAKSVLSHKPSGRTLRYGEVAAEAARLALPAEPATKPQSEWKFLGKASPPKLNAADIARGTAVYGIDVKVPGMVHAALLQCPVHGGKLKHHDPKAVLGMPGVRAVVVVDPGKTKGLGTKIQPAMTTNGFPITNPFEPTSRPTYDPALLPAQSGVAVIADHYWQAKKALDALPVEWELGDGTAWKSTEQLYAAVAARLDKPPAKIERKAGDVSTVTGGKVVEATYATPFCESAPMEPLNGTALVTADKVELWVPAQDQRHVFWMAADETGLPPEKVLVHQTYMGGQFGRRTMADDVRMAVAVAKEYPGVPVKVIWSREEMMRQGRYRTPIATRYKAVLGADGLPQALSGHACFAGLKLVLGYADNPYLVSGVIPNLEIASSEFAHHVLTGAWRGPCYNSHVFMIESFIDECAAAAGVDPLDYRLRLLAKWDPSWSQCLKVAAEKAGWGQPLPRGQGRGIAIAAWPAAFLRGKDNPGSTVCTVATVEVSPKGELAVKQVDIAFDSGRVANRDAAASQIEGGTLFGLNGALNEAITLKDGAVVEGNFDEYPILRIGEAPRINVHFDALSGEDRFGMIGEPPVGPISAAVANAIYQATGKRLRSTPFRQHDLSWA